MNRRDFLSTSISFSMLLAQHRNAQIFKTISGYSTNKIPVSTRFKEVTLLTTKFDDQLDFYQNVLELPIQDIKSGNFSVKVGSSDFNFKTTDNAPSPQYHFAFNIPHNKLIKAKKWLSDRTEVLKDSYSGDQIIHFKAWNAKAIYFKDPAGNIGELIARNTLDNAGKGSFTTKDMLCISEIGTPTANPGQFADKLFESFGLERYLGSDMFVGDENGLFVIPTLNRPWLPDRTLNSAIHPVEVSIDETQKSFLEISTLPYDIIANS
jgi:catechol 2,3-dioxygenase-like lactoylglutathione lyase family enzyme